MLKSIRTVEPGLKTERKDARLQRRKFVQVSVFWLCALAFLRFPFHLQLDDRGQLAFRRGPGQVAVRF